MNYLNYFIEVVESFFTIKNNNMLQNLLEEFIGSGYCVKNKKLHKLKQILNITHKSQGDFIKKSTY